MSWKMLEKPRTLLASKPLVSEFCEMEPAPYDRPLSERRMMVYERILKAGDFRVVTWASALCVETNNVYRVNGKHTSTMLSKLEKLPDFYVTVERYICDTLNDVAALYNTFDSAMASRTTSDINLAFAATIPQLRGIGKKYINVTVGAAAALKWSEGELNRVSPAEKAEELLDRYSFCEWLTKIIPTSNLNPGSLAKPLLRIPVVMAIMATHDKSRRDAEEFWTLVRDESSPERDNPSRVLARYLVRASIAGGQMSTNKNDRTKRLVSARELYVKCLHAWNAWRKSESTSLNYHANAPIPPVR